MKLSFIMNAILHRTSSMLATMPDTVAEHICENAGLLEAIYNRMALAVFQDMSAEERNFSPHLRVIGVAMRIETGDEENNTLAPMWQLAFHHGPKFRLLDPDEATPYWQDEEADYYLTTSGFLAVYGNGASDVVPLLSNKHDEIIESIEPYLELELAETDQEAFATWYRGLNDRRQQAYEASQAHRVPGHEPLTKDELKDRLTDGE